MSEVEKNTNSFVPDILGVLMSPYPLALEVVMSYVKSRGEDVSKTPVPVPTQAPEKCPCSKIAVIVNTLKILNEYLSSDLGPIILY